MSYVTYNTKALVCGSFEQSIADKTFILFTREAGMIFATAKSVRQEVSKQRYALQDFSEIRVSLVKGKQSWRIGSVEAVGNFFSLAEDRLVRGSVVSLFRLLRRFIRGEEAAPELYDYVVASFAELLKEQPKRNLLELVIEMQVLARLGYIDLEAIPASVRTFVLGRELPTEVNLEAKLEKLLSQATDSSHL